MSASKRGGERNQIVDDLAGQAGAFQKRFQRRCLERQSDFAHGWLTRKIFFIADKILIESAETYVATKKLR